MTATSTVERTTEVSGETTITERTPRHSRRLFLATAWIGIVAGTALILGAYFNARTHTGQAHFLVFWLGFAVLTLPLLIAGLQRCVTNPWRYALLTAYGISTFVPKFFMSVNGPTYFDEYGHYRHVNDILSSGNWFSSSTFLPVVKYYPGLSAATIGIHDVTRLNIWHSGQVVILLAHCAVLLIVMSLGRAIGLSGRLSFLAALIYSLNPSYMYFDTQFAYESLGVTLALGTVLACVRARRAKSPMSAWAWVVGGVVLAGGAIVTHHLSSVVAAGLVVAIALVMPSRPGISGRARTSARLGAGFLAAVTAIGALAWIGLFASSTISYLSPHITQGIGQMFDLITGHKSSSYVEVGGVRISTARHSLFAGSSAPLYEKAAAFLAPVLALVVSAVAARQIWNARAARDYFRTWVIFIALAALYFLSLPLAVTGSGGEGAHRSWAFSYLGVALCGALGAPRVATWLRQRRAVPSRAFVPTIGLVAFLVLAMGNVAAGENVDYRFPGPYVFGTDTRSVAPELTQLAAWARGHLTPGAHVLTDRFTGEMVGGYTTLNVPSPDEYEAYVLYLQGDYPAPATTAALRSGRFKYFILDMRIAEQLPQEQLIQANPTKAGFSRKALIEMHSTPFARLIYQSPHYKIFQLDPSAA